MTPAKIISFRKPAFSFLVCPDNLLLRQRLEVLTEQAAPPGAALDRHIHWGDEEPSNAFWDQLTLQGIFGKARVVITRQAQQWPAAVWKRISKALSRPLPLCLSLFCLEAPFDKGKPKIPAYIAKSACFAFADKQGWVWRQDGLNERGIKRHVESRASALGLLFQPDALEQFCTCLPPDGQAIENELQKLTLLSQAERARGADGAINAAMTALCASSAECDIFALLRHIESGNLPAVFRQASRQQESEALFFPLMSLLARDMRILWRLKTGENVPLFASDAAVKRSLATKIDFATLAACMSLIMDAEWQVKSGRCDVNQSLDFLMAELTRVFGETTSY